ncbi:hypothetical protein SISNIDRAFT_457686 [Sistotremastrum niveocremeum HHB9708]|uniref:DNA damage-binding protein 1 n=1 Tax=Sistotremastrum niveocremeum HHB9708 TaxID=1314777 RepID=A0A164RG50_9AGAM|nr:hypothetical protein SISNIDRAFT_457686 [Sistotremastrum niveocremeum HHB9708]
MRVVSTFHQPSSVVTSLVCRLSAHEPEHLVIVKPNKLDIHTLTADGLVFRCSLEVWGCIVDVKAVNSLKDSLSSLVLITDHPEPRILLIDYVLSTPDSQPSLEVVHNESLVSRGFRPAEFFHGLAVSEDGSRIVASPYIGKMTLVCLGKTAGDRIETSFEFNVRELNILSLAFLPDSTPGAETLAILHIDFRNNVRLYARDVSADFSDISMTLSDRLPEAVVPESYADRIIPIPASDDRSGGLLVSGGQSIIFYPVSPPSSGKRKDKSVVRPSSSVNWPYSSITAHHVLDAEGSRILFGDKYGRLAIVCIKSSPLTFSVDLLGETSPAKSITYINAGIFFVGSEQGDSQVLRFTEEKNGSHFEVLSTFDNIAWVNDACLVERDGTKEIVTASGGGNTGSLRVIRNGADFEHLSHIDELSNITTLIPFRSRYKSTVDSFLLVSTPIDSRILSFEHVEYVEQIETFPGFQRDSPTLAAGNITPFSRAYKNAAGITEPAESTLVVQVTKKEVTLVDLIDGSRVSYWTPPSPILVASVNATQICVGLKGGTLIRLDLDTNEQLRLASTTRFGTFSEPREISAISCTPLKSGHLISKAVVVGFWDSNEVIVCKITDFTQIGETIRLSHVPRSLLITAFGKHDKPHIMIGLGDGSLVLCATDTQLMPQERRAISLGSTPISLAICTSGDTVGVFAYGYRAAILFWESGHVRWSPLALKGIAAACPFDAESYERSIAFASSNNLSIGRVKGVSKLHIRSVPLGLDIPVQVAHHADLKAFGVGILRSQPNRPGEEVRMISSFALFDDVNFERINRFKCLPSEEIYSVTKLDLICDGVHESFFGVGTVFMQENEVEPSKGRLLLFQGTVNSEKASNPSDRPKSWLLSSIELPGCIYSITSCKGFIVAAVNSAVCILELKRKETGFGPSDWSLSIIAKHNHNYIISKVTAKDDIIAIGDTISSISMFRFADRELKMLAKNYNPLWPLSIQLLDKTSVIGANSDCNLWTFALQGSSGQQSLDSNGWYHIGEIVNKFIAGTLSSIPDDNPSHPVPEQLFFSSIGRIGVISSLDNETSLAMTKLQNNMAAVIKGADGTDHTEWRRPTSIRGPSDSQPQAVGFLDGDFIEQYTSLAPDVLRDVQQGQNEAERLDLSHSKTVEIIEQLQSLH